MVLKEELLGFAKSTSVKGVSRLFRADSPEIRLLWICAITTCLTIGFYQTYQLLDEYFAYSTITQIKEYPFVSGEATAFPNILTCNLNPFDMKNAEQIKMLEEYNAKVQTLTSCNNGSNKDKKLLESLQSALRRPKAYSQYLGKQQARNLIQNISEFLVECIVLPYNIPCTDFAKNFCSGIPAVSKI